MSEIPFYFETPVPVDFRRDGWFKNPKCVAFVTWAFSRCSTFERDVCHDNKKITLKPYQFIFGRTVCSEETGLTEDEVRTQQLSMEKALYLKKCPNKTPNRFTIYEWVTERFSKQDPQQNPQQTPNRPPTDPHNLEQRTKNKEVVFAFAKETRKKDFPDFAVPLPLSQKAKESSQISDDEIEGIWCYLESVGHPTGRPTITRWLKKHGEERVIRNIRHVLEKQAFRVFGASVEDACKNDYAQQSVHIEENMKFAVEFKREKNVFSLKINKKYCSDDSGNDFQYSLDPKTFRKMLRKKYLKQE